MARMARREESRRRLALLGVCILCTAQGLRAGEGRQVAVAHTVRYEVVDLGYFMAREIDERPAMNATGHVAAWQIVSQTHATAVLNVADGPKLIPGTPAASNSFAFGINAADRVVGILESRADLRETQAFAYEAAAGIQVLPSLGGKFAVARSINTAGTIVGNAQTATLEVHATSWLDREAHDLGMLPGGDFSRAFEISDSGDIAGEANTRHNGKVHAVLWSRGHIRDLGLLPGGSFSSAQAVNAKGVAVGFADDEDGGAKAVLFAKGRVTDLGSLGDEPSGALSINDRGQIVGNSPVAEGKMRAFFWEKGRMYDLNDLVPRAAGWLLLTAYRINARGQILAYGFHEGRSHACLLTPIQRHQGSPAPLP